MHPSCTRDVAAVATTIVCACTYALGQVPSSDNLARRLDPWTPKARVVVMTDIANEPDDQMSLVRFLVYTNHFDVEGLIATTSTWMRNRVRPDVIHTLLDAYGQVQPSLEGHAAGFPASDALRQVVVSGQTGFGMAAVGAGHGSAGADLILRAADRDDPRPLWVLAWGGANTLAQALHTARASRTPAEVEALVAKLRVYAISDQDDAGPWIRREFPTLAYSVRPSPPNGEEYHLATWTGISGDHFYRNAPGADFTTFEDAWVDTHIRSRGPLGALYPYPCCIHEGDTPSFLGLIDNGLASAMSPSYGGWGGRYVWRQPYGEAHSLWTQGGDSYPGRDHSRDTVVGVDGRSYTSDMATIWRWRTAFQHDFAARMAWTVLPPDAANHNPVAIVNGQSGRAPITIDATVGVPVDLDARATTDPDGDRLRFHWLFYEEAGSGIPGQPVGRDAAATSVAETGEIASVPSGGPPQPPARIVIERPDEPQTSVVPRVAGTSHVILVVEDSGNPTLTAYRRLIFQVAPAR